MTSQQVRRFAGRALLLFFSSAILAASANAAVIVALVVDPWTTAGTTPDVTSTRSGPGTWHLFALDDNPGEFGFGTYNITVAGAVAVNHRSPVTTIENSSGEFRTAGFNIFRTPSGSTNSNPVQAGQNFPDQTPFVIKGFGQQASSFAAQAATIQPGSTVVGPTTSASWGTYNTIAPYNGKHWLFVAEGTYNAGTPPNISKAAFNIFTSPTTFANVLVSQATILVRLP